MEDLMLMENPYDFGYGSNPRKKRKKSRNPKGIKGLTSATTWKEWTQGTDLVDIAAGVGGLYAASAFPPMVIKETVTTTQKLMSLGVSVLTAVAAGAAGKSFLSSDAGKAAVLGGLAGTAIRGLSMFAGIEMGRAAPIRRLSMPRTLGQSTVEEFADVRVS